MSNPNKSKLKQLQDAFIEVEKHNAKATRVLVFGTKKQQERWLKDFKNLDQKPRKTGDRHSKGS